MKYMTFPASCSFCCIANMIEQYQADVTDRDIVVGAGLPYLFRYDKAEDSFATGAMLQQAEDYNRFLSKYGLRFMENVISKENITDFLKAHIPCMVGLMGEYGKHAMVFVAYEQEKYRFLNPHRENDEQEDCIGLTEEELLEKLSEINHVSFLTEKDMPEKFVNVEDTLTVIKQYRARFAAFCNSEQTMTEIRACRDSILRPVALDLPVMMTLVGKTGLAEKSAVLQGQIFEMIRQEKCVPADIVDLNLFGEIMEEYQELVRIHWS